MRLLRVTHAPYRTLRRLRTLSRPRLPRTRAGRRRTVQAAMLLCVLALLPATWTFTVSDNRLRTVESVPRAEVAVVFGAGLQGGEPGSYLVHRLDTAADLYRQGRVEVILVTGDNSRHDYDEPHAMSMYLTKRGVPHARIVSDFAGFDTWDSCVRAKKIFGVDRAVLVSQGFHIRRAVALCQAAGVQSYGVGVSGSRNATWYYSGVREIVAAGKASLDATFQPDPKFLGPKEPTVRRALTAER
ncbi:ElyC/SanA/YdcF family protein [Streptomyces sp. P9(2023)]|uniref:SanA/YdcF family protein n=1 Tax=Streptomyces sp. P9(2023) TaxID=3064394 RepID=UPI0028F440A3|nr:ElyC/SanA/YdcF family protein [Streptomyces sp. P9(2023)]MDT9691890.1 ElyC/SanA/YdcF family protein [Streptomyces sp. P9(2023)]